MKYVLSLVCVVFAVIAGVQADCVYVEGDDHPDVDLLIEVPDSVQHVLGGTEFDVSVWLIGGASGSGEFYEEPPYEIPLIKYGFEWREADLSQSYAIEPVCITLGDQVVAAGLELQFESGMVEPCGYQGNQQWCDPPWDMECRERLHPVLKNSETNCGVCSDDVLLVEPDQAILLYTVTFRTTGYDLGECWLWPLWSSYDPRYVRYQQHYINHLGEPDCTWCWWMDVCYWDYNGVMFDVTEGPEMLLGDMNCDGVVSFDDIVPFTQAIAGEDIYLAEFPDCNWLNGDINGDGTVSFSDIQPFLSLVN